MSHDTVCDSCKKVCTGQQEPVRNHNCVRVRDTQGNETYCGCRCRFTPVFRMSDAAFDGMIEDFNKGERDD